MNPFPGHDSGAFKHNKERNGFSLIEVIVVGAIASAVMFGIMSMFSHLTRVQKSISQSTDFDNLALLLSMALQNPLTCPAALQNSLGVPVTPPASVTAAAPNLPVAGISVSKISAGTLLLDTSVPYEGMYIQSIQLKQVVVGSPVNGNPVPYSATLQIQGSKTAPGAKVALGGGVLTKDIPIALTFEIPAGGGTAEFKSCSTKGLANSASGGVITTPGRDFPSEIVCNDIVVSGNTWSFVFRFHGIEHLAGGNVIRYRDQTGGRMVDFYANGSYKSNSGAGSCAGQNIENLGWTTN